MRDGSGSRREAYPAVAPSVNVFQSLKTEPTVTATGDGNRLVSK